MTQYSTAQALRDTEWNRSQDAAAHFFAAQDAARGTGKPATLTLAEIAAGFEFSRDEYNTRFDRNIEDPERKCIQAAMRIVSKTNVNDRYLVVATATETGLDWKAYCPRGLWMNGPIVIAAVQARTSAQKTQVN